MRPALPPPRQALLALAALSLVAGWLAPDFSWPRPRPHLVVVIDITQSMNVVDQPLQAQPGAEPLSRLAAARQALRQGLDRLPCGSRLGWAIFTEYRSYLLLQPVEVCAHRGELRDTLAGVDGRMAWSGGSEVAKGLHSAIDLSRKLPGRPAIVFVTDGHEAPPLNPRHRPRFDDTPGEVPGLIVGVGGNLPAAIPKLDPRGRPLGPWAADEVLQTDPRSRGRGAGVAAELMVEGDGPPAAVGLGATPGSEHLSSLREPYLRLLAGENGLAYHRLRQADELAAAMLSPALAQPVAVPLAGRGLLGALALALLLLRVLPWPALQRRLAGWPDLPIRLRP
ncbi:MAG: VWA domain-containing protein [Burkholderiaceae bacterium]|nr:VWA domain-containing protein [Burkholderiaceae bacterium]